MTIVLCDQRSDSGLQELHRFNSLYGLPDFVKQADWQASCVPPAEEPRYYADIRIPYQFPIHSPEATVLSQMYFTKNAAAINSKVRATIRARLDKFTEFWGVKQAVQAFKSKYAELNGPAALSDDEFALVRVVDGRKECLYPLRNALESKTAAAWFQENINGLRQDLTVADREKLADRILQKAADYGADIPEETTDFLERQAGHGTFAPTQAAQMIRQRYKLARKVDPQMRLMMEKLAEYVSGAPSCFFNNETLRTLRETIETFDRNYGVQYSPGTPAPEDLLCSLTYRKMASVRDSACQLTTGSVYDRDDLARLKLADVAAVLGDDVATEVTLGLRVDPEKMAEVAATLPRPDALRLEVLLSGQNVFPISKQAKSGWSVPAAEL